MKSSLKIFMRYLPRRLKMFAIANLITTSNLFAGNSTPFSSNDIPDPAALSAYTRFWDAFQDYERQKRDSAVKEYQKARDGLNNAWTQSEKTFTEKRISILIDAVNRYQDNLTNTPNATNRPFVLLNLAQIYAELSFLQGSLDLESSKSSRQLALTTIKDVEDNYPGFAHITDALYLRASLMEANDEHLAAKAIWRKLAATGQDRFALHGNIVVGDDEFESASPEKAIRYYERAKEILDNLDPEDRHIDDLRINYRLSWANFKAQRPKATMAAIRNVLGLGYASKALRQREKILKDLADIAALTLFAENDDTKTKSFFTGRDFVAIGPQAAIALMSQYIDDKFPVKAADIGALAVNEFATSPEFPDLLNQKARADELAGRKASRLESLEKLSMLLPAGSLWRHRNSENFELIRHMESLSRNAAESVAATYYEEGMASGNIKKFTLAATHYGILLNDSPNSDRAPSLRLNIANCQYFAGNLMEAERGYSELISGLKTPETILTTAHYQRALTLEKLWRAEFESAIQKSIDPTKNPRIMSQLAKLESAIEDHANRFPGQSRSVDLLLVAASANRDHNRFAEASKFWQRALISNPSPGQRSIAVRGIVFAKIRNGSPAEIISSVGNFLKLEGSEAMPASLRQELLGVVASAASEQSSLLAKKGSSEEAGTVLLQVAGDFPDMPNREQSWRDGAYFLAISGEWARAQASAESYMKQKFKKFSGDMTYLIARAQEYQLRFSQSAQSYLDLAENNPSHPRAMASLDRAEKLALADNNYPAAGQAAQLRAERQQSHGARISGMDSAISLYLQAGTPKRALAIAERRKNESKTLTEKLEAELSLAKIRYQSGEKQIALDDLDTLAKQIDRAKFDLGDSYRRLAAETNMLLGESALRAFQELRIDSSTTNPGAKVEKKSHLFTEIAARFDKVASLDRPDLSPKARFLAAQAAAEFADQISGIPYRNGEPTTLRSQTRFNQNINRLREMAQKYHGNNILAKQRSPQAYARNEWISRSAIALSGGNATGFGQNDLSSKTDQLSTATSSDMPQQWSH